MDRYTKLYRKLCSLEKEKHEGGVLPRLKRYHYELLMLARDRIVGKKNPVVKMLLNGQAIDMQLANELPLYKARYQSYDKPIAIISKWIYKQNNRLNFVDVGANVGDTVVNIGIKKGNYLVIEGDKRYYELIERNLRGYKHKLMKCFMSDSNIEQQKINASYMYDHTLEKVNVAVQTLDDILDNAGFEADIIKTDTDGYDLKVIRSGTEYIQKYHPFLFIEWYPKYLIENNQENPQELFEIMRNLGYKKCILFDNFGVIQAVLDTDDELNFKIFEKYSSIKNTRIYYWDICFIPPQLDSWRSLVEELMDWEKYC